MSAVKHAFEKIGEGIAHVAEGIAHGVEGVAKTIGGALTANPSLMKQGAEDFDKGRKEVVSGVGEAAGGVAGAVIGMTPVGAAINSMTHGAASRLAEGVGTSVADTVNKGVTGAEDMVKGAVTGNGKEFLGGLKNFGSLAADAVPVLGEEKMAADVLTDAGKQLLKNGAKDSAQQTVFGNNTAPA